MSGTLGRVSRVVAPGPRGAWSSFPPGWFGYGPRLQAETGRRHYLRRRRERPAHLAQWWAGGREDPRAAGGLDPVAVHTTTDRRRAHRPGAAGREAYRRPARS